MIKLTRFDPPDKLTPGLVSELTIEFQTSKKDVWRREDIKKALLEMSHGKCCYCEIYVKEKSTFMQVEHFLPKSKYPKHVVTWSNLLPSCQRCNTQKGSHDTKKEPIIDPTDVDPREHIAFHLYRFKGKDELGENTIEVVWLNDYHRLQLPRFEVGERIQKQLEILLDLAEVYESMFNAGKANTQRRNRIVNGLKDVLREALPNSEFSATAATILIIDINYKEMKKLFQRLGLWDSELDKYEQQAKEIALDIVKPQARR